MRRRYQARLSGPMRDRLDMSCRLSHRRPRPAAATLSRLATVAARVATAAAIQAERQGATTPTCRRAEHRRGARIRRAPPALLDTRPVSSASRCVGCTVPHELPHHRRPCGSDVVRAGAPRRSAPPPAKGGSSMIGVVPAHRARPTMAPPAGGRASERDCWIALSLGAGHRPDRVRPAPGAPRARRGGMGAGPDASTGSVEPATRRRRALSGLHVTTRGAVARALERAPSGPAVAS